jgi:hypothetical protein
MIDFDVVTGPTPEIAPEKPRAQPAISDATRTSPSPSEHQRNNQSPFRNDRATPSAPV